MAVSQYDLSSDLGQKLKKQLEYYFSDSNYPRDKFLRGKAAENDGWIPIEVLLTFNRVKNLTKDFGLVKAALSACEDLEVNDDKVKRKNPIPEKDMSISRSIYAKGFPVDDSELIIDNIIETFSKYGKVLSVRIRRNLDKKFKGSAYIEFATDEEAKKFVEENKTFAWKPDVILTILPKEAHVEETREKLRLKKQKNEEGGKKRKKEGSKKTKNQGGKKRKLEEAEGEEGEGEGEGENEEKKGEVKEEKEEKKGEVKEEKEEKKEEVKEEKEDFAQDAKPVRDLFQEGLLIEVKNIPDGTSHMDLKAHFAKFGKVRYVDCSKEKQSAIVRFYEPEPSKIALAEIAEKKLEIQGNVIEGRLLEGEEEKKYWDEQVIPRIPRGGGRFGKRGRGRGRGGRYAKRRKMNPKDEQ